MNVKNGFSTLNRLLGKKNKKDNLSKSTTNLSSVDCKFIDASSQLQHNRITPLPAATSNAPFEQTFRITVLLPKDQLYVARLGAKIKLQRLLELVCDNKQLDIDKYEFRHSADSSQVFDCELTIGAVGLTEIRLCHKSETYDNFNADEIVKLRRTVVRDSLSSSELSSRNSKQTPKTASPYSSSNSLNSLDSTGMNSSYRGAPLSLPPQLAPKSITQPPVAPTRKKRTAPRPPSQFVIPEKSAITTNGGGGDMPKDFNEFKEPLPRKDFHVSTPNLSQTTELSVLRTTEFHTSNLSVDCNGNNKVSPDHNTEFKNNNQTEMVVEPVPNGNVAEHTPTNGFEARLNRNNRPMSMHVLNVQDRTETTTPTSAHVNGNRFSFGSVQNLSTNGVQMPEPSPRKRLIQAKKKAPAPPPRFFLTPVPQPRLSAVTATTPTVVDEESEESVKKTSQAATETQQNQQNISKVILNRSPTPQSPELEPLPCAVNDDSITTENFDSDSKNADSGIGEPVPSPPPDSLKSESSQIECKSPFESSSDEDEQIKVYNLKLGKTIVKPLADHKALEDLTIVPTEDDESQTVETCSLKSESTTWNFTIPAPPNFADSEMSTKIDTDLPDTPITPIIKERTMVDFDSMVIDTTTLVTSTDEVDNLKVSDAQIITSDIEDGYHGGKTTTPKKTTNDDILSKAVDKFTKLENEMGSFRDKNQFESMKSDFVTELNNIINETGIETVIKSNENTVEIESANRSSLNNFTIQNYSQVSARNGTVSTEIVTKNTTQSVENSKYAVLNGVHKQNSDSVAPTKVKPNKIEQRNITESRKIEKGNGIETTIEQSHKIESKIEQRNGIESNLERNGNVSSDASVVDRKSFISVSSLAAEQASTETNECFEEERLYKKRSSITLSNSVASHFKHRRNISRSDSFHSTQQSPPNDTHAESLSSRSSSYVSLQRLDSSSNLGGRFSDTNGRKSSSELSIGESPSLQSLIIMKSILNSRKNSANSEDISILDVENKSTDTNGVELRDKSIALEQCSSSQSDTVDCKEIQPKNKMLSQQIVKIDKKDESDKKWRYSGPPSINFSTWNERPKVQVAIKNEGDYIFGGGGNGRSSYQPRSSQTASIGMVGADLLTTSRVPIVRAVEYKKSTPSVVVSQTQKPFKFSEMNNNSSPPVFPKPSFLSQESVSLQHTTSTPHSPKSISETNKVPTTKFVRLISSTPRVVENKPKEEVVAPFSQMTLRKTGLKDKILANTSETSQTTPAPTTPIKSTSAKIELKQSKSFVDDLNSLHTNSSLAVPGCPPPPPPPVIRGVVTKNSKVSPPPLAIDPRDELLSAIRGFKKGSLNRT